MKIYRFNINKQFCFRQANKNDLEAMMTLIDQSQGRLKSMNINQWQNGYPSVEIISNDISNGNAYILEKDNQIAAMGVIIFNNEPTYDVIYNGKWLSNNDFAVIHRVAVSHQFLKSGLASLFFKAAESLCIEMKISSIKVDTHQENKPMRNFLEKHDYTVCGEIIVRDGTWRIAYEKLLELPKAICVYSASSDNINYIYKETAKELGKQLALHHFEVINGAGGTGLMRTVADAAIESGGKVKGIIPSFMIHNGWHYNELTEIIEVDTIHERKQLMANFSDAVIALPGGCGTLEELLEIITWKQLNLFNGLVIIMNTNNFYDPLISMLQKAIDESFMEDKQLWTIVNNPKEAIDLLLKTT